MSDTEKKPEVYEVVVNGAYRALLYATNAHKARSRALQFVDVRKLSGSEVAEAVMAGTGIDRGDESGDGIDAE
jgi:hypothetical protein